MHTYQAIHIYLRCFSYPKDSLSKHDNISQWKHASLFFFSIFWLELPKMGTYLQLKFKREICIYIYLRFFLYPRGLPIQTIYYILREERDRGRERELRGCPN
ncbi:hypothetical protein AMTRI_Chr13g85700 [Amborella trichopoda]